MATQKKIICPLMQKPCIEDGTIIDGELCACKFWVHVVGKHPQTGVDQDLWDCSHSWLPVLLIDNTNKQRETGAAVENFRNEMVNANAATHMLMLSGTGSIPDEAIHQITQRAISNKLLTDANKS